MKKWGRAEDERMEGGEGTEAKLRSSVNEENVLFIHLII